jgi:predicted Zn-dependent protease
MFDQESESSMKQLSRRALTRREFFWASAATISAMTISGAPLAMRLAAEEPHPIRMPFNDLTDEDEVALGDIIAADLEKEIQIVKNQLIDAYLGNIVDKLAKASQRPNLPYRCKLVNSDEINAYSIAGGRIYLNRALVAFVTSEDQLVATLSHEIGHVVARHSANQIMLTFKARHAYELVKNHIPQHSKMIDEVIEKLGGAVAMLAMLQYSRENELEADKLGFYEMLRAGYQPSGFLRLFQMLDVLEKQSDNHPVPLLRDHPPAADRARAIKRELAVVNVPNSATTDSLSFHAFRLAMNLLPAPPKPESDHP